MRTSDIYFYAATSLWALWILYYGGFFSWVHSTYLGLRYRCTPSHPVATERTEPEQATALRAIWSASKNTPGIWKEEKVLTTEVDSGDGIPAVEEGYAIVPKEI